MKNRRCRTKVRATAKCAAESTKGCVEVQPAEKKVAHNSQQTTTDPLHRSTILRNRSPNRLPRKHCATTAPLTDQSLSGKWHPTGKTNTPLRTWDARSGAWAKPVWFCALAAPFLGAVAISCGCRSRATAFLRSSAAPVTLRRGNDGDFQAQVTLDAWPFEPGRSDRLIRNCVF